MLEQSVMGCVFRGHFFGAFQDEKLTGPIKPLINVKAGSRGGKRRPPMTTVAGIASEVKSSFNKEGRLMGQVTLEDGTASMVVRFYGDDWKRYRNLVKLDELVIIKGSAREDKFVPSGVSMSGRSLDVPATLRAKNGVTLLFKAEDPNFDFDTLKPIGWTNSLFGWYWVSSLAHASAIAGSTSGTMLPIPHSHATAK